MARRPNRGVLPEPWVEVAFGFDENCPPTVAPQSEAWGSPCPLTRRRSGSVLDQNRHLSAAHRLKPKTGDVGIASPVRCLAQTSGLVYLSETLGASILDETRCFPSRSAVISARTAVRPTSSGCGDRPRERRRCRVHRGGGVRHARHHVRWAGIRSYGPTRCRCDTSWFYPAPALAKQKTRSSERRFTGRRPPRAATTA